VRVTYLEKRKASWEKQGRRRPTPAFSLAAVDTGVEHRQEERGNWKSERQTSRFRQGVRSWRIRQQQAEARERERIACKKAKRETRNPRREKTMQESVFPDPWNAVEDLADESGVHAESQREEEISRENVEAEEKEVSGEGKRKKSGVGELRAFNAGGSVVDSDTLSDDAFSFWVVLTSSFIHTHTHTLFRVPQTKGLFTKRHCLSPFYSLLKCPFLSSKRAIGEHLFVVGLSSSHII